VQQVAELVGRLRQPRHDLLAGEAQHRAHVGRIVQRVDGGGVPVSGVELLDEPPRLLLDPVGLGAVRALDQAERAAKPRQRTGRTAPGLLRAQDAEHQVDARRTDRRLAEYVQAVADEDVLDLAQVAVDVQQEVVELLVGGRLRHVQVVVQLRGRDEVPDLATDGRELARVHRLHLGVLVEQLLELRHLVVALGPRHRRHQVVDDGGVTAALGLRALARVVDDERVEQRQVAEHRVGRAAADRPSPCRQPLERPVLAEVDDGVRPEAAVRLRTRQPAVGGR
jgi:hypothetical protein